VALFALRALWEHRPTPRDPELDDPQPADLSAVG
jgi:hypothetical protein